MTKKFENETLSDVFDLENKMARQTKMIVVFDIDPSWEIDILAGLEKTFGHTNAIYQVFMKKDDEKCNILKE